ncbi:hypothetical protein [Nocardioides alkalitolerans]|uniref:hypothetical protein n=1 Tax=Nocardioides alkalitolerans TaxID=281714 RepID=UPI000416643E|nr:hypothetical protein [Nocardioides alkalitolerans]
MTFKRALTALAAVAALSAGATAVAPTESAEAVPPFGGQVQNVGSQPVFITYNLANPWSAEAILSPGGISDGFRDADGFYVESGCRATYLFPPATIAYSRTTPGWVKINNTQYAVVNYSC